MVFIESYYGLYEVEKVSPIWKGLQIFFYVTGACNSIASAYTFAHVYMHYFDQNCLLYSDVRFIKEEDQPFSLDLDERSNKSTRKLPYIGQIDNFKTEWGKETICLYCQYVPICSFISFFVWATFFTMCGKGGRSVRGLPSPWRIVVPAIISNVIYFIVSLVAASSLQGGYRSFCTHFKANMNKTSCEYVSSFTTPESDVYSYIVFSELFAWADVTMWLLSIGLLVVRCIFVPDFDLRRIQLHTPSTVQTRLSVSKGHVDAKAEKNRQRQIKMNTGAKFQGIVDVAEDVLRRKMLVKNQPQQSHDVAGPSTATLI